MSWHPILVSRERLASVSHSWMAKVEIASILLRFFFVLRPSSKTTSEDAVAKREGER